MWLLIGLFILVSWLYYKWYTSTFTYWQKRGIPSIKGTFRNDINVVTRCKFQALITNELYQRMAPHPLFGTYSMGSPSLVVKDPELIRLVLAKEFSHFRDRIRFDMDEKDVIFHHLFNLKGDKWRVMRVKLTPTFTSGKLKAMFPLFMECAEAFNNLLLKKGDTEINIKELMGRLTTDIICSCAFGLDIDTINNPDNKLRKIGMESINLNFAQMLKFVIFRLVPVLKKVIKLRFTPIEVQDYLVNFVKHTVEYREKHNIKRNDFLDLLIQLKNKGTLGDDKKDGIEEPFELTTGMMAAQCFLFFVAGFETSSSVQTFCLYELALNQEIQTKLRNEIDNTIQKHGGITYQAVQDMEYLDMVVSETMRKYPTLPGLLRSCNKSFMTPFGYRIEAKDSVVIPVWSLHHDPEYFPNPEKFDPERFSAVNKDSIKPFTYLPFGEGPRICIGSRFGQMQTKVGIITILRKLRVEPCKATKIPLEFDGSKAVTSTKDPIVLKLVHNCAA